MQSSREDWSILLSSAPVTLGHRRAALAAALLLLGMFLGTLPFAQVPWVAFPGFVLIQQTLQLTTNLITAALLFGQYSIRGTRALNILAAGFLFTAMMIVAHTLSFPGAFSEAGLLRGTPWLYVAWHAVLPLTVILYALRPPEEVTGQSFDDVRVSILVSVVGAIVLAIALTLLMTAGHQWLPTLVEDGRLTPTSRIAVAALLLLPLAALLMLAKRRDRSVLDLWLMVVMFAWICTITLVSFFSAKRFDIGWYAGRIFDALTSICVLLVLLSETIQLYARLVRTAAAELREREQRVNQAEAILIHLSRVSEIGQGVSSLIHEVNQPLSAISNYVAACLQLIRTSKFDQLEPILERTGEQSLRAIEIIRLLRDFIARRETDKSVGNVQDTLNNAIQLAMLGVAEQAPIVQILCAPAASSAFFNRVQIEQVVFNLARNAIEAMADSTRRTLIIATILYSDDMVEVSIADTGSGLPPEVRERLFEPFVSSKTGGLGIGLSVCSMIVEAHGGRLAADDNPGGGTVFRFTLPRIATAAARPRDYRGVWRAPDEPQPDGRRERKRFLGLI